MTEQKSVLFLLADCPGYFTELFLVMAKNLKENGIDSVFAVTTPFYEEFKRVKLNTQGKVYYLNEYLEDKSYQNESLEDYQINNWSYYASYSRQCYYFKKPLNSLETLKKTKHFFQRIYSEHKIALQVSEGVSSSFLYLAYEQGMLNNIPYFGLMGARIPYHFNVHTDIIGNEVLLNTEAAEQYQVNDDVPDYMKNSQFGGLFDKEYSIYSISFLKEIIHLLRQKNYVSLEVGMTKRFLFTVYKTVIKRMYYDYWFQKIKKVFADKLVIDPKYKYVIYPLHFYPEASTSVYARHYDGNEYNIIRNIAFSLPSNFKLIVKEHKSNVGNNSAAFYESIKNLPNTTLLTPYFSLKENLDSFDAVVTISSTVGFEALTMGIPVFTLGDVFYQNYPGSTKIESYAHLDECLKDLTNVKTTNQTNSTLDRYNKMCFPGSFNYMSKSCLGEKNVHLLLSPILDYLRVGKLKKHRNDIL